MKVYITIIIATLFIACEKSSFLNTKPTESIIVPQMLSELQMILDNSQVFNGTGSDGAIPSFGEAASDDYYMPDLYIPALLNTSKNLYTWNDDIYDGTVLGDWDVSYRVIFYANVVLDGLKKITKTSANEKEYLNAEGSALFYRAFYFYQLAQIFAPVYDKETAASELGIPLRLSPDVGEKIARASLQDTYNQIVADLKSSSEKLPLIPLYKTRPSKIAAYALLARVYLLMGDFDNALLYADNSLKEKNGLINFNSLTITNSNFPLSRFNDEVIFHGVLMKTNMTYFRFSFWRVDSILFKSYNDNDLRKRAFFRNQGGILFRGSMDGSSSLFGGLAVDENYLIRAECYARKGLVEEAMSDLNYLIKNRWDSAVEYPGMQAVDAVEALDYVLAERRKELLFRGVRWSDLRRLNKEGRNIIPKRLIQGTEFILEPNSRHYTFLIPPGVIQFNPEMPQNFR